MYTRCPSCRAEISFEPPVHADSLPDGYKHKIKCPSCGVTIGVKIPRHEAVAQPGYAPIPNNAPIEQNYDTPLVEDNSSAFEEAIAPAKKKKFGRAASAFAMIWALLLTGFFVVAYLANTGILPTNPILAGLEKFDIMSTIIAWFKPGAFADQWATDRLATMWNFVPAATLLFAFIHFIVSFSCLCAGKYSKGYNVIWTLILFAGAAATWLLGPLVAITAQNYAGNAGEEILGYIKGFMADGAWLALIVLPALGFISFLTSLCSLGVKNPNKQRKAKSVE